MCLVSALENFVIQSWDKARSPGFLSVDMLIVDTALNQNFDIENWK